MRTFYTRSNPPDEAKRDYFPNLVDVDIKMFEALSEDDMVRTLRMAQDDVPKFIRAEARRRKEVYATHNWSEAKLKDMAEILVKKQASMKAQGRK